MLIIDVSQTIISCIMTSPEMMDDNNLNVNTVRQMVLKTIKSFNNKFKGDYGNLVIAVDSGNTWRKSFFPYYKIRRKEANASSTIDWSKVYEIIQTIKNELKEFFPYPVIEVPTAEADDVIGCLCRHFGAEDDEYLDASEKILILSRDKDFIQLHKYNNVEQYDPIATDGKWIRTADPVLYLKEHIIRGDAGDSIPNILSEDNRIALKIRQKPIMSKKLEVWVTQELSEFCDESMLLHYARNKKLIDLSEIPDEIYTKVIDEYISQQNKPRNKILNYLIKNRCRSLLDSVQDF